MTQDQICRLKKLSRSLLGKLPEPPCDLEGLPLDDLPDDVRLGFLAFGIYKGTDDVPEDLTDEAKRKVAGFVLDFLLGNEALADVRRRLTHNQQMADVLFKSLKMAVVASGYDSLVTGFVNERVSHVYDGSLQRWLQRKASIPSYASLADEAQIWMDEYRETFNGLPEVLNEANKRVATGYAATMRERDENKRKFEESEAKNAELKKCLTEAEGRAAALQRKATLRSQGRC